MWIKEVLICIIGLCSGGFIAAGLFSFIAMVGVLTRLATRTNTANQIMLYEDMVVIGATIGNYLNLRPFHIPGDIVVVVMYGIFSGIFVGCLAIALAEVINAIPVFGRRIKLKVGIKYIVCVMGAAKFAGAFFQLVTNGNK